MAPPGGHRGMDKKMYLKQRIFLIALVEASNKPFEIVTIGKVLELGNVTKQFLLPAN